VVGLEGVARENDGARGHAHGARRVEFGETRALRSELTVFRATSAAYARKATVASLSVSNRMVQDQRLSIK
jgi:hypothetical protein